MLGGAYCCSDRDFTVAERRTKDYKRWAKADSEAGLWMNREIDILSGEDVRRSGYVVSLGKIKVQSSLKKEYEDALPRLQGVFASMSEAEQAPIVAADERLHAGNPEDFVRWARSIDPSLFPSRGNREEEAVWADFAEAKVNPTKILDQKVSLSEAQKKIGPNYEIRQVEVAQRAGVYWIKTFAAFSEGKMVGYITRRGDGKLRWNDVSPYHPPTEGRDWRYEAQPNPATARRTHPALWKRIVAEVTASSKGGLPGQWSARKAQLAVLLYKKQGGGYLGPKSADNALT